jgi:hypothetical protein
MPRDGLLRYARNDVESWVAFIERHLFPITVPVVPHPEIFFTILVDGIFTTFVAPLFTNTSHAIRANGAASCV